MFDAVPNDSTGYVFAAYIVFLVLILVYLGILGAKFQRISRDLSELTEEVESGRSPTSDHRVESGPAGAEKAPRPDEAEGTDPDAGTQERTGV